MSCPFCRLHLAPRSWEQLRHRQRQIEEYPQVGFAPCPQCQGTDWALLTDCLWEEGEPERPSYTAAIALAGIAAGLLLILAGIAWGVS